MTQYKKQWYSYSQQLALKVPPVALTLLIAGMMWAVPAGMYLPGLELSFLLTTILALLGIIVCLAGVLAFRLARTTVDPTEPAKTSSLVVTGIYHCTRNPMYLGFLLLLLAWAFFLGKLSAFACIPVFIWYLTLFQIKPEEEILATQFGSEYTRYTASVRRWL